jgi:hypothetical protein
MRIAKEILAEGGMLGSYHWLETAILIYTYRTDHVMPSHEDIEKAVRVHLPSEAVIPHVRVLPNCDVYLIGWYR